MNTIHWVFSGIGVLALALLGRLGLHLWRRRSVPPSAELAASSPAPSLSMLPASSPPTPSRFTKPTPDEMIEQVSSLPPFQQETASEAYQGLQVCWQALFLGIEEDRTEPPTKNKNKTKKATNWLVCLKHYDPTVRYAHGYIYCPGISLERYPELKIIHNNELVIVSGTVTLLQGHNIELWNATLEFTRTQIISSGFGLDPSEQKLR